MKYCKKEKKKKKKIVLFSLMAPLEHIDLLITGNFVTRNFRGNPHYFHLQQDIF